VTTTDLYPYLIIIGISILVAAGWLLHQYRTHLQRTRELIHLNEELAYDLPNFLRQCWPILNQSGFSGLEWQLDWFGTRLAETYGRSSHERIEKAFEVNEIKLTIRLYLSRRGLEQQYFSNAQADNFFLMVRMNLWIKLGTVQGAFDQTARMTVFLKHDVKNMVQLLSLSSEQLQSFKPGQEAALLASLREAIPSVQERAEHMLRSLTTNPQRPGSLGKKEELALEKILQQTANLYDLDVHIEGQALLLVDRDLLLSVVDNILGNYSHQARKVGVMRPALEVRIECANAQVQTHIRDSHGKPFPWPERLFEPFWSEHGGGRGIGLYQARQQAITAGGYLDAKAEPDAPLEFYLSLPAHEPEPLGN
jgi:signal transduction histidine kinase